LSNTILTQSPAQSTLEFYVILTSMQLKIFRLSCRLPDSSTKSFKSVFQLVSFSWK